MKLRELQYTTALYTIYTIGLSILLLICLTHQLFIASVASWIAVILLATIARGEFKKLEGYVRNLPKSKLLQELRSQQIFRPLANHLLRMVGIPTRIPAGAMNALLLGSDKHARDGSPLDCSVYWDTPGTADSPHWFWCRTDKPVAAIQNLVDGTWRRFEVNKDWQCD